MNMWMNYIKQICGTIKQNESEVSQNSFYFFAKLPFTTEPTKIDQLVPKIRAVVEGFQK